jgi:uracil-DNA glycosylase
VTDGARQDSVLGQCRRCRRLCNQLDRLATEYPDYWNRPVPAAGPVNARLLIVGLAPGKHGANRTGVPFTGDASGTLLFRVLSQLDILNLVRITNAVKCLPIDNLPNHREIMRCQRFLVPELAQHRTVLALGTLAHKAVLKGLDQPAAPYPFQHGIVHTVAATTLISSYHCSRYNTQTGRLTEGMLQDVVELAASLAGLVP